MQREIKSEPKIRVRRYSGSARFNHWVVAICFILLMLSGFSLFHPSLYFVGQTLFGDGRTDRLLHPWIGVVLTVSFLGLFLRFFPLNLPVLTDFVWLSKSYYFVFGHEDYLPEVGKYNPGQKFVFWSQAFLILTLLASGILLWGDMLPAAERLTGYHATIDIQRWAAIVHGSAAVLSIVVWIIHVYAAIWIKGSMDGMTRGTVTGGWGWRHHRKWLRKQAKRPSQIIDEQPTSVRREKATQPAE